MSKKVNVNQKLKDVVGKWLSANGRMTQIELAERMQYTHTHFGQVLNGVYGITNDFANCLENATTIKRSDYCE